MSSYPNLEELYCANAGLESLNVGNNPNLYSLTCEGNSLTSLDLSKTGELWYEKKVSPQARIVFANVQEECMVFDMKTIVPELGKVSLPAGEGYIYDNSSGLLTVNGLEEKNIAQPAFINVNDGTNEGMAYVGKNIFTVQFHPEACPGPQDSGYLFDRFMKMMGGND